MRKTVLLLFSALLSLYSSSQDCGAREAKLFEYINNFSSAYLFNTYGLIGSIADAHANHAYEDGTVTDLLNAQKKLAADLSALIEKNLEADSLISSDRKGYLLSFTSVLKACNEQIDLYLKYMKNDSKKNRDAYVEARKKLWKDINTLYGIKD